MKGQEMDGESEKRGHELLEDGGLMSIKMLRVKFRSV